MSIYEPGRLCLKVAGRDAGRRCVIVERINEQMVLVDGDVRRKKVNVKHLEVLPQTVKIGKGTSAEVKKAFTEMGLSVWETKSRKVSAKPMKQKAQKAKKDVPEAKSAGKK
jgi:large subunit ribosomal protein L14e